MTSPVDDDVLFAIETPPPVSLADKFGVPPMSVLDRRQGDWQERKRKWLTLGMQSELGRNARAVHATKSSADDFVARLLRGETSGPRTMGALAADGVSVFDPVLCELVYRWFSPVGGRVLDPFAGGSVRGIVASTLARWYVGVDLRDEQIAANRAQTELGSDMAPRWIRGDSRRLPDLLGPADEFDLVFSCPPYADLERYSDDPADLSTMPYEEFQGAHADVIAAAVGRLRRDRFACWVVSDVRDKRGAYRGFVADTISAFRACGLALYNDAVVLDHVGAAALRAERPFVASRKLTRVHQHLLVFVKGNAQVATLACSAA